ncbi:MAG: hypothetical protein ACRD0B_08905 [Acidimicrobiales bacterium]
MSAVWRALSAFGRFWWEFLVGDTPELFLATLAVVGLALLFGHVPGAHEAGVPVVLVAVVGFLAVSTWRGRRRERRPGEGGRA